MPTPRFEYVESGHPDLVFRGGYAVTKREAALYDMRRLRQTYEESGLPLLSAEEISERLGRGAETH